MNEKIKPIKTTGLSSLGDLRTELVNKEPIKEGHVVTPEMLRSNVSKKILGYFFKIYPKIVNKMKKKPENAKFINEMEIILSSEKDLSEQNIFYLNDLYLKFIKEVPITQSSSNGVVFGKIARGAGCAGTEAEEAKKLLDSFIEPALKKMFSN
jgi:hypothetical protein